jgi:hypothetical protein
MVFTMSPSRAHVCDDLDAGGLARAQGFQQQTAGGIGTRIWGLWTVAWVWN